jgi:hypothetical protein
MSIIFKALEGEIRGSKKQLYTSLLINMHEFCRVE